MASASALVPVPALGYVGARSSIVAIFLSAITDIPAPSYNTQGRPISPVIPHLALGWKIPGPTLRWPSARPCGFQRLMVEALAVPDASRHKPTEIEDSPEPEEWSVLAARQGKTKGREREDATRMVREEPGSRIMREVSEEVETRDLSELEERTHYPSSSREYPPSLCRDYPPSSLRDYPRPTRDVPPSQTQPRRLRIASPAPDDVYKFPQPTMSPYALGIGARPRSGAGLC
ncbi:hypothetical protein RhiLY_12717 [Ceratobasidium sp. AG-Ba]|nr:hypothetical protein RhiLY_12717 [Ceratobasidium sp. AG-Ba]